MRARGARRILFFSMPASAITLPQEAEAREQASGATEERRFQCDSCGKWFEGEPGGAGLFLWTRGDEVRYEEPPLCEQCAYAIAVGGTLQAELDEEG